MWLFYIHFVILGLTLNGPTKRSNSNLSVFHADPQAMRLLCRLRPLRCFAVLLDLPQLHVYPPAVQSDGLPAAATHCLLLLGRYRLHIQGADKSLARQGRKEDNVYVRMAWISFGALPYKEKTLWQLASRVCWNHARLCHASELVSFLVRPRTYQHPGTFDISMVRVSFL